ncbi:hypothetical protein [Halorussus pelagicus]|uniref:hypothetical protein n=1 Tax=Halorussus pelagicus TaxID=2505977 RepID=UPI000FFBA571|nr:hypothetical protein [Halorussus pelagicus]
MTAVIVLGVGIGFVMTSGSILKPDSKQGATPHYEDELKIQDGRANVTGNGTVDSLELTITKGDSQVDLSGVSITWVGPHKAVSLVAETTESENVRTTVRPGQSQRFYVSPRHDTDESFPVLNAESDRFELVINATAVRGKPLSGGERVGLDFTTATRSKVLYTVELPDSLGSDSVVEI